MPFGRRFSLAAHIILAVALVGCGDKEPDNRAPVAVTSASATSVDERQTFTLSATQSSDPDGDSLTFQWAQTAGPSVTIADPTLADLSLVMPETTTGDDALQFSVSVSDGMLTKSDMIDIALRDIVMSPINPEFQPYAIEGTDRLKAPTRFNRRYNLEAQIFCDVPPYPVDRQDIIGQMDMGEIELGSYTGNFGIDSLTIPGSSADAAAFSSFVEMGRTVSCFARFSEASGSWTISDTVITVHAPSDGSVYQAGPFRPAAAINTLKVDDQPGGCAAQGIYSRDKSALQS